jgi:hypothetical protein
MTIFWDIVNRDIQFQNGTTVLIDNPSTSNGGIIAYSSGAFVSNPVLGVGILRIIGSSLSSVNFEMNRWAKQCYDDGAKVATYIINSDKQPVIDAALKFNVSY